MADYDPPFKIIYIAGPITGKPNNNRAAFLSAEKFLEREVPEAEIINPEKNFGRAPLAYSYYMRRSAQQLSVSTHAYVLSGWEDSKGTLWELEAAQMFGLKVAYERSDKDYKKDSVIHAIESVFRVSAMEFMHSTRKEPLVTYRQLLLYTLYGTCGMSHANASLIVGSKEHGTCMQACRKIENLIRNDKNFSKKVIEVERLVKIKMLDIKTIQWK